MPARKLRMGMIGGGRDAFIGAVHRMAAALDGKVDFVAGAFSSDPEKSKLSGQDFFLNPDRVYANYKEMVEKESALPENERIDFVSIVTPNHMHFPPAKAFLEAGFHVVCDKPMTFNLEEAIKLKEIVEKSGKVFALTHNYTSYPMVKEARDLVKIGKHGRVLKVVSEYPQGWLINRLEEENEDQNKQAAWRTDPKRAGASCCIGDIGTHAENLALFITGLEIDELCADFTTFVDGRPLEDDGNMLVRYKGGAKGIIYASQISVGDENNLNIRVYCEKGAVEWYQEHPNELILKHPDRPREIIRRGNGYVGENAQRFTRIPSGHPERYLEGFANIYLEAVRAIHDKIDGKDSSGDYDFPNVDDGLYGMAFLDTAVRSASANEKWVKFTDVKTAVW